MGVGQDAQETMDAKLRQKCAAMLKVLAGADAQGRGLLTVPQMRAALRHNPPALRLYLDHEEIERVLGEAARQVGNTHSIDYHEFVRRVVGARAAPAVSAGPLTPIVDALDPRGRRPPASSGSGQRRPPPPPGCVP